MSRIMLAGATSQTIYLEVLDSTSTTGGRKTGLAFGTAGLTGYYALVGGSATVISLITQTVTGAYSSGGFVEVDGTNMPGIYRLDLPNAAIASGPAVIITLKGATGMVQVSEEIQLLAVNLQDSVRAGLTALPNAAAEAAGGLYTRGSGAGQINQAANGQVDTNLARILNTAVSTPATAGVLDVNVKNMNNVAATSITTVNANVGTTQPQNFTGTGASALVKGDAVDINSVAASAVTTINANLGTTQPVNFTGTAGSALVKGDAVDFGGQAVTAAAGVTVPSSIASPTNITAGTITTATNLTNAPTNGDFTAAMKTSLNAATPASITGAVASVTGNVGGNVVGTVGSVVGAVGSVTGAVGSVTGNVGGNVTGSVGSVVGAVGSVTGAVGSVTGNVGGNVVGSVGSVVGGVTVTTNNDKTGYGLSAAAVQAIWDALTSALTTANSIGKLLVDNINATISSRLAASSYTAPPTAVQNADATLARDLSMVATPASRSLLNSVRFLRNKRSITGGTLTVTEEDDTTSAWTATILTSPGDPVSSVDPT